jgi:hypothetical protein
MAPKMNPPDRLTVSEVDAELRRFVAIAGAIASARTVARLYASGLRHFSDKDLLQEAMTALLSGERVWPRGLPAQVVLQQIVHSIASNERKKLDYELERPAPNDDMSQDAGMLARAPNRTSDPARIMEGKSELERVTQAVAGDEEAELLVELYADGLRGDAAMKELGWDRKTHDAARKRLIRRLDGLAKDRRT